MMDWGARILACLLIVGGVSYAAEETGGDLVVVQGAVGEPRFELPFTQAVERWRRLGATGGWRTIVVGQKESSASDRDLLLNHLESLATEGGAPLWVVLVGHGTFDGRTARFNLRGPDVAAVEFDRALDRFRRPLVVGVFASSSGPWLSTLSGPGRTVVTSTRSGGESSYSRFGEFMPAALMNPASDLDRDSAVSLWEGFVAASRRVEAFYKEDARVQSEHALLDDNGDGLGSTAEQLVAVLGGSRQLDGWSAKGTWLHPPREEAGWTPERVAERGRLERQLAELIGQKATMEAAEYQRRLEELLVAHARLSVQGPAPNP